MQKRIVFKNMEHSEVIENFANEKLAKIEKLLESERIPKSINLVIEWSKVHANHKIDLKVCSADFHLIAQHEGADIHTEIIKVVDKMVEEIRTEKDKRAEDRKKHDSFKSA